MKNVKNAVLELSLDQIDFSSLEVNPGLITSCGLGDRFNPTEVVRQYLDSPARTDPTKPCPTCKQVDYRERTPDAGCGSVCNICHPAGDQEGNTAND